MSPLSRRASLVVSRSVPCSVAPAATSVRRQRVERRLVAAFDEDDDDRDTGEPPLHQPVAGLFGELVPAGQFGAQLVVLLVGVVAVAPHGVEPVLEQAHRGPVDHGGAHGDPDGQGEEDRGSETRWKRNEIISASPSARSR